MYHWTDRDSLRRFYNWTYWPNHWPNYWVRDVFAQNTIGRIGLLRDFEDAYKDKKKTPLDTSEWNLVTCEPDTPQQLNGFDCGVFT